MYGTVAVPCLVGVFGARGIAADKRNVYMPNSPTASGTYRPAYAAGARKRPCITGHAPLEQGEAVGVGRIPGDFVLLAGCFPAEQPGCLTRVLRLMAIEIK
nr:unnamed protein product [Digitaria exilis]